MKLLNQYKTLNADEKDLIHSLLGAIPLMFVFLWFVATANPRPTAAPQRTEKPIVKSYELPASYLKYSQRVYNEKYGK
jgi:hypothetical protein